ncbi:MAG: DUF2279 domain-containing protein [Ferruginibacter sp.]
MGQIFVHSSASPAKSSPGQYIFKSLLTLLFPGIFAFTSAAQDSVSRLIQDTNISKRYDPPPGGKFMSVIPSRGYVTSTDAKRKVSLLDTTPITGGAGALLTSRQVKSRVRLVAIGNVAGYSSVLAGFSAAWYSKFHRSRFHTFNDNEEWLQIDKVGHMYGAYIESRLSMELWRWTGIDQKKRIWFGGLSGVLYQTIIETLDGFSSGWGWSWGDIGANVLGSGTLIAQELAWGDQRIKLKFSFHINNYGDTGLNNRADKLYGKTFAERLLKDYNAQTFWASINLRSFLPKSNLPTWLAIAVGYGTDGMFGARDNTGKDENGIINFDRRDIRRYRQLYLSPDIDFTKIKTKKKGLKLLFTILNAFKFPAPGLEFSKGKLKVKALLF